MLKELFESVVSLSQAAQAPEQPQFIPELKQGLKRAFVLGGTIHDVDLDPAPRAHTVERLRDFAFAVETFKQREKPDIFVSDDLAVAVLDDDGLNTVRLPLPLSATMRSLATLPRQLNQRSAIEFMRRDLLGTGFDVYAEALRAVVFDRSQSSSNVARRDQESMGRSVESKVSGTSELPETIDGQVPVFRQLTFLSHQSVTLGVDVKLQEELFELWLPPDELENALTAARIELAEELADLGNVVLGDR